MDRLGRALLFCAALVGPVAACGTAADPATLASATDVVVLDVEGMTCASCSVTVRAALRKLDGIGSVEVDVDSGKATVRYDGARVRADQIASAIADAGYRASVAGGS